MQLSEFVPIDVRLRDGRHVTLRTVDQQDKEALQLAIKQLSPESRYARFMSPLHELTPELLDRAVNPDAGNEMQIVAVAGEGPQETIIGGARYNAAPGSKHCEFAMAIVDDWQGHGLARRLLETLLVLARVHGFEQVDGFILANNTRMLALAKKLGFIEIPSPEGPTVRLLRYVFHDTQ